MDLITRIREKIVKIKKNGETPNIIWMGIEEKKEFQSYMRDEVRVGRCATNKNNKTELMGLPVEFVSSPEWLSVTANVINK